MDHSWVNIFGERIMMQMPEDMVLPPAENDGRFVYLMQFNDGNRIDLTLIPLEKMDKLITFNSLMKILLDKDGIIGLLPTPNDRDFHIIKPTDDDKNVTAHLKYIRNLPKAYEANSEKTI